MRIAVALVLCSACIRTSAELDGDWSRFDVPCTPLGDTQRILETRSSLPYVIAGDTLLYSPGETVRQFSLTTGEDHIIMRSDGVSEFGVVGNDLVYYESDGDPDRRLPIDVIIDRGARTTSRYQRISPYPGELVAGLLTTPNGIYWWTTTGGSDIAEWRWNPTTSAVEPFAMNRGTIVQTDDTSFFYFDPDNRLVVRSQTGGPPTVVADTTPLNLLPPLPLGIDGDEVFYAIHTDDATTTDIVARRSDGSERVLLEDRVIYSGAIDPTYVYFTEDSDNARVDLYRVPRAGGEIETVFHGPDNSTVFDVQVDRCNVYWQVVTVDSGGIYAREITQ